MKKTILRQLLMLSKRVLYGFLIQFFFCTVLLASTGNAQRKTLEEVKISVNLTDKSLSQFFRLVEAKTDFKFTFSDNLIDLKQRVTVVEESKSVYEVLLSISTQTDLSFVQVNENIHVKSEIGNSNSVEAGRSLDILINGRVIDENGEPIPGATVFVEGTNIGTVTNIDGEFELNAGEGAILIVSFIGYSAKRITVSNQTAINVILSEDLSSLEEVVVVGYGAVKKSDLTGSVSQVKAAEINAFPTSNIMQALSGRAAGVQVIQNTGAPGAGISVRIRGTNSIQGGNEPLYVIDGFPFSGNPTNLNNFDIESIEVLKDASATAIYGSRGANGVVLITTKQGKEGVTTVDFETSYSIQTIRKKLDLMNGREYAELQNMQAANDNLTPYFTQAQLDGFGEGFDWQDLIFQQAPILSSSLNVSGGNNKTQYSISGSFFGQEGIIKGSDYNRYSIRTNINHAISDKVRLTFSNTLTHLSTERRDSGGGSRGNSMIGSAISAAPISSPFNDDGSYRVLGNEYPFIAVDVINPLNFINEQTNETKSNVVLTNLAFSYNPIEDLTLKISGGIENRDNRNDAYTTRNYLNSPGRASVNTSQFRSLLSESTLSYNKTIGTKHQVNALAGFTYQDFLTTSLGASGLGFLSDAFETYSLAASATPGIPSSGYSNAVLLSYLGRVNYSFDGKYLFTASFRSDGSSRYSPENKWGYFPSGAFAWRISDENFFPDNSLLSDMKFRASWGLTGSQAINPYATLNQLNSGRTIFENRLFNTFAPSTILPGDLKWETTEQIDIGLDMGFWEDRVVFNADYYIKNTRDLLNTVRLPSSLGFTTTIQNIGAVQNKGIEFSADAKVLTGAFRWDLFGNIAFNRNRVVSLNNGEDILGAFVNVLVIGDNLTILREGRPIGQFYGFMEDGYTETGQIRFQDLNGDGTINNGDKTYIGDPNPQFIYGLNSTMNYRNFEFSMFIQGSYGNDIFNVSSIPSTLDFGQGLNMPREVYYDHWTVENPNAKYPRISRSTSARVSDRFVEEGSFLRFRNIQLAYQIPRNIINGNWFRSAQVYASAQNFITLTNYSWWDPEVNSRGAGTQQGIDHYSYPIPKSLTFGFRLGF
ncbi:TonB-linked outer membrane protein, SusC/RagA family [Cyclobacterium xiamenense]|uniref:TonB-linked outer membrane protein, SusC/RagA family n=1 Tax=Cyclobacterium xiamenense TaxID=1297121 RepID=A0A1H7A525_9BACT|nr:TonB-dependent receptor [Cyclobacterium xiamenense]SEJ60789.1 TonB-linked outer membrane protein, SusC/RagA family [Cyclobacterium xiamenense]